MSHTQSLIDAAGRWFLQSGIQEQNGGVARYYRSDLGRNAHVSTEITGYTISALVFLYERSRREDYLDAARRAARFLTRAAWDPKLDTIPFEHPVNGDQPRAFAYFFDCGIIVRGLLGVWRASNEAEFRDTAVAIGRAMLRDFGSLDSIHPILALPDKCPMPYQPRWSAAPGCYQLKSAMAWHDLFEVTGESEFERAYEGTLQAALSTERDFLPGDPDRERVMDRLHPYSYFLEGLLPVLHRDDCQRSFQAGLDRLAATLREIAPQFARSDVYAQLLRARLYGESLGVAPLDSPAAAHEAEQIAKFQLTSDDPRIAGGFGFGRKKGELLPFVNPVSTAFAVQALALWHDHQHGELKTHRHALI